MCQHRYSPGRGLLLAACLGLAVSLAPVRAQLDEAAAALGRFGCFEVARSPAALGLAATLNPYDPAVVQVNAIITTPTGQRRVQPCFWYVPQAAVADAAFQPGVTWERFVDSGPGEWRCRFSPETAGEYTYTYSITQGDKTWTRQGGFFSVGATPAGPAPIRVAPDHRSFRRSTGEPFIPVGLNLAWTPEGGAAAHARWLERLHAAGGNCARVWLTHFYGGTRLEWSKASTNAGYAGAGVYSQESAARLDRILASAQQQKVALILCLFTFSDLGSDWTKHPYNQASGGWLSEPTQWFTDPQSRLRTAALLRYLTARYGWSNMILAWELWNEVDLVPGVKPEVTAAWMRDAAISLRGLEVQARLLTTSYAQPPPWHDPQAEGAAHLDLVTVHAYLPELVRYLPARLASVSVADKPYMLAEFGLGSNPDYFAADPAGLHLHDGQWTALMAGAAGGGLPWWWDNYIDQRDLYYHFTGLARFVAGESLAGLPPVPAQVVTAPAGQDGFVLARAARRRAWLWAGTARQVAWHDEDYRSTVQRYSTAPAGGPFTVTLTGTFDLGAWRYVAYDPFDGTPVATGPATATATGLTLELPAFRQDLALKCLPADDLTAEPTLATDTPLHERFLHGPIADEDPAAEAPAAPAVAVPPAKPRVKLP